MPPTDRSARSKASTEASALAAVEPVSRRLHAGDLDRRGRLFLHDLGDDCSVDCGDTPGQWRRPAERQTDPRWKRAA